LLLLAAAAVQLQPIGCKSFSFSTLCIPVAGAGHLLFQGWRAAAATTISIDQAQYMRTPCLYKYIWKAKPSDLKIDEIT